MLKKNILIKPYLSSMTSDLNKLFNLHTLVYEQLSTIQPGWLMHEVTAPASMNDNARVILYHKSSKKSNLWYGFCIRQAVLSGEHLVVFLKPACGTLTTDDKIDTQHIINNTRLYENDDYLDSDQYQLESLLTIGIGKRNTSCFISVTLRDSGYILMNAVSGEDTLGNVYAFSPSIYLTGSSDRNPMIFYSLDESGSVYKSIVNWSTYTSDSGFFDNNRMGVVMGSDMLALSPFVNPVNGNICPDLFTPLFGPGTQSRLYDVSVNGRTFITGSSNPPAGGANRTLEDDEYNVTYKVFMEV